MNAGHLVVSILSLLVLCYIAGSLSTLVEVGMKTEADLKSVLDEIQALAGGLADKFQKQAGDMAQLREQVAAGTPVTQEQLDGLVTEAGSIRDSLNTLAGRTDQPPADIVVPATAASAAPAESTPPADPAAAPPAAGDPPPTTAP